MADPVRICVIGNSHIAHLRAAWAEGAAARHPGLSLTFRGRGQEGMRYVHAEGTRLVCDEAAHSLWMLRATGVPEIETAGFDAFLLVGLWPGLRWLERMLGLSAIVSLPSPAVMLVSDEAATAAATDAYAASSEHHVAGLLRRIHGPAKPIFALPMPRLSAAALDAPVKPLWAYPEVCRAALADGSAADWGAVLARLMIPGAAAEHGLIRLDYPPELIENHILSPARYRRNAPNLEGDGVQPDNDYNHMNAEFGGRVIDAFAGRMMALG